MRVISDLIRALKSTLQFKDELCAVLEQEGVDPAVVDLSGISSRALTANAPNIDAELEDVGRAGGSSAPASLSGDALGRL